MPMLKTIMKFENKTEPAAVSVSAAKNKKEW